MDAFFSSTLFKVTLALVATAVVLRVVLRMLFPPKVDSLHLRVRCASCGWTGTVGKYQRKCAKCASTAIEEQKR